MKGSRAPRRTLRWLLRAAAVALLTAGGVLAGAGLASAHAVLTSTDPAANATLAAPPAQVTLTFGESVALVPNGLRVFGPDGAEVDDARPLHPGGNAAAVAIGLRPTSAAGSYTVAWRVISADTHPVAGAFTFAVGHPSATAPAIAAPAGGSTAVGVLYAIVRALGYAGYAALTGATAFLLWCWPAGAARSAGPRVAAAGWATVVLATVATVLLEGPYGNGTGLTDVFAPGTVAATLQLPLAGALITRLLLLIAAAVYLGQLTHRLPGATRRLRLSLTAAGTVLAVGLAATWSVSGHAAYGLQPQVALPLDVAHLLAMGIWLGGLAVLALALRHPRPEPGEPHGSTPVPAIALRRFSRLAQCCVIVLVATGTYQSWRQLGSWAAFTDTAYGRLLLAKLFAVGALLVVAAGSRRAVHRMQHHSAARPHPVLATAATRPPLDHAPAADPANSPPHSPVSYPSPRRTVLIETLIAALVLSLTAVLVNTEPGRTAHTAAPESGPMQAHLAYDTGGPGGTGTLDVHLDPTRAGPNTIDITNRDPTGATRDLPELDVELTLPDRNVGPLPMPVTHPGPGRYQGHGQIPFPGAWQLALTVRTSDIDETTVRLPVTIRP